MKSLKIDARNVIEAIIPLLWDINGFQHELRKHYPDKTETIYVPFFSEQLQKLHRKQEEAIQKIYLVSEVTGISVDVLYCVTRTALKWYRRKKWQYCLSEEMASKLLEFYM